MYKDDSDSRRADFSVFFVLAVVLCRPFSIS